MPASGAAPTEAAPAAPASGTAPIQASATPASATPAAATPPIAAPGADARQALGNVRTEVGRAVVGQDQVVTGLIIALLCRGHVLLEGVPGVAKTLLVRTLSRTLDVDFSRVQFTPDLMPGDVTGSLIYDARTAAFSFREGPIFTNLMLADEINRTPPKTQSALLEAMEERQVTVDGEPRTLPDPFLVIATQNPIEYSGTYPLPEAQLDRFLLKLPVGLPERDAEIDIVRRHAGGFDPRDLAAAGVNAAASVADLESAREAMREVTLSDEVAGYIVDVCRATREAASVAVGVSPRGATALMKTARAWAWMRGGTFVTPDDVKALAPWTLGHRMQLRAEAELEGVTAETVLGTVLAAVPVPR
ncbi:AAA family ATPase [Demequina globuliformis]|uniref:AAA family ATPase n=1 Tax=Demequina globuliformis TaxID=676202 RepID=UPI000A010F73